MSRATVAGLLSMVLPGAGSYYLGRATTAGVLLLLEIGGSLCAAGLWRLDLLPTLVLVIIIIAITLGAHVGGAALAMVEAWRGQVKRPFVPAVGYMVLVATLLIGMQQVARDHLVVSYVVTTIAMEPTLHHGDRILARPRGEAAPILRGEVVTIHDPVLNEDFVRRLIGLPGDHVRIEGSEVFVNGASLRVGPCATGEPAGCFVERSADELTYQVIDHVGTGEVHLEVEVPADAFFVLRDRRDLSLPFNPFPRSWLFGVVTDIWWSHSHLGVELGRIGQRVAPGVSG